MRLLIVSLVFMFQAVTVLAEPLSEAEQAALNEMRDGYLQSLADLNAEGLVGAIPPGIIGHLAEAAGVSEEEVLAQMPGILAATMTGVTFTKADIRTEALDAQRLVHEGTAYVYGFAPTVIELKLHEALYREECGTLALYEQGTWYLVRTTEAQQVTLLRTVYPFFEGVEFPEGSLTRIE